MGTGLSNVYLLKSYLYKLIGKMGQDYYSILNLSRSVTDADIKKAYRKLSLKYHPEKNVGDQVAAEKFKQVSEAYDVLSDPRKRATYDQFGEEGLKNGVPAGSGESGAWTGGYTFHGNADKVFRDFFGGDNPFQEFYDRVDGDMHMGFGGLHGRGAQKQDPPIERELALSLEEVFHGCTKKMKISRRVMNEDGHTSSIRDKILTITVKRGWKPGTRITFPKEGDQGSTLCTQPTSLWARLSQAALWRSTLWTRGSYTSPSMTLLSQATRRLSQVRACQSQRILDRKATC